jgi:hypothetical protein
MSGVAVKGLALASLFLLAFAANAAEPTTPASAQSIPTEKIKAPSTKTLILPLARSHLHKVSTSVTLTYDQIGTVVNVTLDKPTGSKSLDKAIVDWASGISIDTHEAGSGSIPVSMQID